jgi:uncharacterized membrane-anchored protein YhcB (DUF1043 family)
MLTWLKVRIAMIVGLIGVALATYFKIKQSGKNEQKVKDLTTHVDALKKKQEVAREVDRLPDGDAAKRLRDAWSRD